MATATIYVTAADDDGYESSSGESLLDVGEINVNAGAPLAGFILRAVPVPPTATVSAAYFRGVVVNDSLDSPNLTIRGELSPADYTGADFEFSSRAKTSAGVVWNESDIYGGAGVYVTSPNLAAVFQEIIEYGGWAENGDIALYLIDRGLGGGLRVYDYDHGPGTYPPFVFLEWTAPVVVGELDYGWPGDYWPDEYWAEYWPDYGTDVPAGGAATKWMHYQRQRRRMA